jgi:hypothetical protein
MAVTITISTNGGFKVFSSTNATLATAVTEVINEVEDQRLSGKKVQFNTTHTGSVYAVLAYVSTGSGVANA